MGRLTVGNTYRQNLTCEVPPASRQDVQGVPECYPTASTLECLRRRKHPLDILYLGMFSKADCISPLASICQQRVGWQIAIKLIREGHKLACRSKHSCEKCGTLVYRENTTSPLNKG